MDVSSKHSGYEMVLQMCVKHVTNKYVLEWTMTWRA